MGPVEGLLRSVWRPPYPHRAVSATRDQQGTVRMELEICNDHGVAFQAG